MNKQGSVIFFGFMIMFAIIILAFGTAPMVKEIVDQTRNSDNLDCDNAGISNVDKVTCIVVDMSMFYFIVGLIALGIGVFIARKFK